MHQGSGGLSRMETKNLLQSLQSSNLRADVGSIPGVGNLRLACQAWHDFHWHDEWI